MQTVVGARNQQSEYDNLEQNNVERAFNQINQRPLFENCADLTQAQKAGLAAGCVLLIVTFILGMIITINGGDMGFLHAFE